MKKYLLLLASASALAAAPASASIAIDSVTPSSTFFTYDEEDLINGSGLTGNVHDGQFTNKWLGDDGDTMPTLLFDLGSVFSLTETSIWNYGGGCCGTDRNVDELEIFFSTDNVSFNSMGVFALTNVTTDMFTPDTFALSGMARYVRFDVLSNQGDSRYTGLSEVQFDGVQAAVPEPGTWAMLILGFGLMGGLMRRSSKPTRMRVSYS